MNHQIKESSKVKGPLILAPAGNKDAFLAAIAAGADAVYCGLKEFSARMEAENFSLEDLSRLAEFARKKDVRVHVAMNSLIKPEEPESVGWLVSRLIKNVAPDAFIIQDLGLVSIMKQAGFKGALHLSTLGNLSFPAALSMVKKGLNIDQVVIPRELNIDEIREMASACPDNLGLEVFVHGALCYGVSGRCYWSSYLGGKSGLRGRCVQPCRRVYRFKDQKRRFFSCQDLSLDVLAKVLLSEKKITTWKIEGRKKGPHYVYHTVKAYRLFRDQGNAPETKKLALGYLENALGRHATHYNFLPQRPQLPVQTDTQTGSGRLMGVIQGPGKKPYLSPREPLIAGDILRLGYEDGMFHTVYRVTRSVPKKGRLVLNLQEKRVPKNGTPVFLLDRREKDMKAELDALNKAFTKVASRPDVVSRFELRAPNPVPAEFFKGRKKIMEVFVNRRFGKKRENGIQGLWLTRENVAGMHIKGVAGCWWWLPPVIWPAEEKTVRETINLALKRGGQYFVLNAPYQTAFFDVPKTLKLWAGPFCNTANIFAIKTLATMGFSGVIVSPELGHADYIALARESRLPLGIVVSGNWPLCISRTKSEHMDSGHVFTSPKGEQAWIRAHDGNYWVFPNWKLDFKSQKRALYKAGYQVFVHLTEPVPRDVKLKNRPGLWNWEISLK